MLDAVDPQSANKGATGSSRRKFDLNKHGFSLKSISKEKITLFGQEKLFGMSSIGSRRGHLYDKNRNFKTISSTHGSVSYGKMQRVEIARSN